jgi:hypothetical protein
VQTQAYRFQISRSGLGLFAGRGDGSAHSPPNIQLIRKIERQRKIAGALGGCEVGCVGRLANRSNTRRCGDGWKLGSSVEVNHRPRFCKSSSGHFQILVRYREFVFQRGQLRIAEDFPPLSTEELIARLRRFPAVGFFERVARRSLYRGSRIMRTHRATHEISVLKSVDTAGGLLIG